MFLRKFKSHPMVASTIKDKIRFCNSLAIQENSINKNEVIYPEIEDLSLLGKRRTRYKNMCKELQKVSSVEEKLFKVNMPRYYGYKTVMIEESNLQYNILPCAQHLTKTYVVPEKGLPSCYDHMTDPGTLNDIVSNVKSQIEEALLLELNERRQDYLTIKDKTDPITMGKIVTKSLMQQINRIIINNLSEKYQHLFNTEVDYEPRLEAFWTNGGIPPRELIVKVRSKFPNLKDIVNEPVDIYIQYEGDPLIHLRNSVPLREIISIEESQDTEFVVPDYSFHPVCLGYYHKRRHVTNIPGFWPGDQNEFGLLSYNHRSHFIKRNYDDNDDALIAQAIFASFGWLLTQACYQGFSPFNDIIYPLVNQMIITNGQLWSFYVYQLNTTEFGYQVLKNNPKKNICWATEPMKLYDTIENGKVYGLNDEVLKLLVKLYINVPEQRDYDMKPYLGEVKVIADYEDEEKRAWLEKRFKHLMSVRPRHRPLPEILQWQKIFMMDNNTRPLEKKREPWEFNINPYRRRLDEHSLKYIPKALRPHPKKKYKWEKFEKTYYP